MRLNLPLAGDDSSRMPPSLLPTENTAGDPCSSYSTVPASPVSASVADTEMMGTESNGRSWRILAS